MGVGEANDVQRRECLNLHIARRPPSDAFISRSKKVNGDAISACTILATV